MSDVANAIVANSGDSSEDEESPNKLNSNWHFYSQREEWKDVTPIPQDDGPHPIVAIAYTEQFRDAYDYFRAILKCGEKSERALDLTSDCLLLNPANYTVWQYRRDILKALGKDLENELQYTQKMIKKNSKNYQVWHHRKAIVEKLGSAKDELEFTQMILGKDSKNYHAWQHRQWCIKTFNMYDKELCYVDQLLEEDVRNNSAWNQRYFVLENTTNFEQDVIDREVYYALEKIDQVCRNESAWSYLRGILVHEKNGGLGFHEAVTEKCKEMYVLNNRSNHLLSCIIDIIDEKYEKGYRLDEFFNLDLALQLCNDLGKKYDKIRVKYWEYISQRLSDKYNKASL